MTDFVTVAEFENAVEAELAKLTLENNGIQALAVNTHLANVIGLGQTIPCAVKVKRDDLSIAKKILAATGDETEKEIYNPKFKKRRKFGMRIMLLVFLGPAIAVILMKIFDFAANQF